MHIVKNKLPKGFSYPLKAKDVEDLLDKFEKHLNTLSFSDYRIGESPVLYISYYGLRHSFFEPGSFSIRVRAVVSAERNKIRAQLVDWVLPFVMDWITKFDHLDEHSTIATENQNLEVHWDIHTQDIRIVDSLEQLKAK